MSEFFGFDEVPLPHMTTGAAIDARRTDRIPIMREVQLRSSDGREFTAFCTDVNQGGIGIDTDHTLRVGQRLTLHVTTRSGELKSVPLLVIYRIGRHYGLSALASLEAVLELLPING